MRRLAPFLLVFLVLTAGCANFLPWSHSESAHPQTTSEQPASYPPGANGQWIFDTKQLVAAHEKVLDTSSYRVHVRTRLNRSTDWKNWGWENKTLTSHIGGGHAFGTKHVSPAFGPQNVIELHRFYYTNDTLAQCTHGERCSYRTDVSLDYRKQLAITNRTRSILASSDFVAKGTTTRNGTTLYRYAADGNLSSGETLSATVLVDKDGFIHDLSGTVHTNDPRPGTATFDYSFTLLSHPPATPDWVNSRPRLQFRTNASEVTFKHTGGPRLPKGTNISVGLSNQTVRVQLPKSLGRGDVAHFTITDINETTYETTTNISVNRPITNESAIDFTDAVEWVAYSTKHWGVSLRRNHRIEHSTNSTTTAG